MKSNEIQGLIKLRNYLLGGDELAIVISPVENPQLDHITYNSSNNSYEMWSNTGEYFHFNAMNYEEAEQKGFVKEKKKGTL